MRERCRLPLGLLLTIFVALPVFAIGLNLSASNIPDGMTGPVEFCRVVGQYDPPGGGDDKSIRLMTIQGGLLAEPQIPIVVSENTIPLVYGGPEKDNGSLNDIDNGTKVFIRIWDGAIGQKHHYVKSEVKTISWGPTDPKVDWTITSWTRCLADVPQNVGVKVDSETIKRTGSTQALTIDFSAIHDGQVELVSSKAVLEISKDPTFTDVNDPTGGVKHFDSSSASASGVYYTGNTTYYLRSQLGNYYGVAPVAMLTSPVKDLAQPGESVVNAVGKYLTLGGGGAAAFTFNLLPIETGKLVVNTVFLPAASVTSASALAARIDGLAGSKVTKAVCRWDPVAGKPEAALFDDSGNILTGSKDFSLTAGECYQIYTTKNVTITLP
jgi:hypothetical protein